MDTISIAKSEVPSFLQSGEFYGALNDDEDHELITIPSCTFKKDTCIKNNTDLHHLLSSLRFWGVSSILDDLVKYCVSELEFPCDDILQQFAQDFPYVAVLISIVSASEEQKMLIAVKSGMLEIARNLPEDSPKHFSCGRVAAEAGNVEILQYLHERYGNVLETAVLAAALKGGKGLVCVQYLRAQEVEWPYDTLTIALLGGNKECFHYALQDGCVWEKYAEVEGLCKDESVDYLKYAVQHGCPLNTYSTAVAAGNGAIQCLLVLHEANCPWDASACLQAARNGKLECLQYLHEQGCPWNEEIVFWAVDNNHTDCALYALRQGCPIHTSSCFAAASQGNLLLLRQLHEASAYWHELTCAEAARKGHLDCLQYAHENGCPWGKSLCSDAATSGHLHCLQYAHEHGALWDEVTFRRTFESGQLECLKYLLENGCPIDKKIMEQGGCEQAVDMVHAFVRFPQLLDQH